MTPEPLKLTADPGTRLVLARHGETPSNVRHALDTVPPGPGLTERGHGQAGDLAERLSTHKVLAVHASRALRAQQTARPVAERHGLEVQLLDGTHEVYVGEIEGSTDAADHQLFEDVYANWHFGELDVPMPGGETGRQALTRFVRSAQSALDGVAGGTLVLVSHGAMVRLVAGYLATNVDGRQANATYLPNTGTIVLDADPESGTGWHCAGWSGVDWKGADWAGGDWAEGDREDLDS